MDRLMVNGTPSVAGRVEAMPARGKSAQEGHFLICICARSSGGLDLHSSDEIIGNEQGIAQPNICLNQWLE